MLKKLFHYFKYKKVSKKQSDNINITITLMPDLGSLDVEFNYPDLDNYSIDNIPNIAEKCAELIIYVHSNHLKYKMLDLIQDKAYKSEDIKQKLLFDNIISFYEIFKQELKNNYSGPLISPTSVFSNK